MKLVLGNDRGMLSRAEYLALQAKQMLEADLEREVKALCKTYGVVYVHHLRSKGTTPGWPDDQLIGTRLLIRELKKHDGRVSTAQKDILALLEAAGQDVAVWRPADLISGRIEAEIRAVSLLPAYRARTPERPQPAS